MGKIFIFKPDTLDEQNIGFLEGFCKVHNDNIAFYITKDKLSDTTTNDTIGYCSNKSPVILFNKLDQSEWIHINNTTGEVTVNNLNAENEYKITCISYNYNAFCVSEVVLDRSEDYGKYFEQLSKAVQRKVPVFSRYNRRVQNGVILMFSFFVIVLDKMLKVFHAINSKFKFSTALKHLEDRTASIKCVFLDFQRERTVSVKSGNIFMSHCLDLMLGMVSSYYFSIYMEEILDFLEYSGEHIIYGLEQLLKILMGSPAGLKLNYGFNNALGKFFFYHISLWRAFLYALNPMLESIMKFFMFLGGFGLSFQIALSADFLAFITFHVYCIYVYAARLYWLQISALLSLWNLFIGRKWNPLRNRIDSCQYTHHQLFIGTLGFTILLFLLPTTLLYYSVFTIFRIGLVFTDALLNKIRNFFQHFPLYVIILWMYNSPNIAGSIYLVMRKAKNSNHEIFATLTPLPLMKSVELCTAKKFVEESYFSLGPLLHKAFSGALI